ncbi:alpha-tocopherol transfer protein [Galendromus occidentalis]|uniref:Alpha-tocopherol transfer protein n=1 Tax=Galendromus occidentalis TaxID=34638 RepID=A0AAJ6QVI6_9ACAR|nr:alpha-tocopherol transfer protein [Galendromus occidentalis]
MVPGYRSPTIESLSLRVAFAVNPKCLNMAPRISSQNWLELRDIMDANVIDEEPIVPPELKPIAECELNETPENRSRCIETVLQLLSEDKRLKSRVDDAFLMRFLRPAKFNPHRACRMITRYYKMREEAPDIFENRYTPRDQLRSFGFNLCTVLPHKDAQGRTLFIVRAGAWDPSQLSKKDFFMSSLLMMELSIRDVQTLIKGTVVIIDMAGLSLTHIKNFTPKDLKRIVTMIQDCFPCRIKAIHVVNQPNIFSIIWAVVSQFLTSKIASRVHLHGENLEGLYQQVDRKFLPDILGGPEPLDCSPRVKELLDLNDALFEDGAYGYRDFKENYRSMKRSS